MTIMVVQRAREAVGWIVGWAMGQVPAHGLLPASPVALAGWASPDLLVLAAATAQTVD